MAKPTNLLVDILRARVPTMASEMEGLVSVFDKNVTFAQGSSQDDVDEAFKNFFVRAAHMKSLETLRNMGCGPSRCATCDGSCGK